MSSSTARGSRWLAKGSGPPRNTAAVAREAGRSQNWASTAPGMIVAHALTEATVDGASVGVDLI